MLAHREVSGNPMRRARTIFSALALAAVAMAQSPAMAQRGRTTPVSISDVDRMAVLLSMTPDQKAAAEHLRAGYEQARQEREQTTRERRDRLRAEFRETRAERAMEEIETIERRAAEADRKAVEHLMAGIKALLTPEQEGRWGAVERLHRRDEFERSGLDGPFGGGWPKMDLLRIIDDLRPAPEHRAAIADTLEAYELDLDRPVSALLRLKDEVDRKQREFQAAVQEKDVAVVGPVFEQLLSLVNRLRTLNQNYARRIALQLPEAEAERLRARLRTIAYPAIERLVASSDADNALAAAERFKDLDEPQAMALADLRDRFRRDMAAWRTQAEEEFDRREAAVTLDMVFNNEIGRLRGTPVSEALEVRRAEIERRTLRSLRALLTDAQRAKLPRIATPVRPSAPRPPAPPGQDPGPEPMPDPEPDPDPDDPEPEPAMPLPGMAPPAMPPLEPPEPGQNPPMQPPLPPPGSPPGGPPNEPPTEPPDPGAPPTELW